MPCSRRAFAPDGEQFSLRPEGLQPPCTAHVRTGLCNAGARDVRHSDAPSQKLPVADVAADENNAASQAACFLQDLACFRRPFHPSFRVSVYLGDASQLASSAAHVNKASPGQAFVLGQAVEGEGDGEGGEGLLKLCGEKPRGEQAQASAQGGGPAYREGGEGAKSQP